METSRHTGMGRRAFLQLSSIGALATAAVGPKMFAGEAAQPQRLAVGFVELEGGALAAAERIPGVDGGFISRGARISVSGGGTFADAAQRRAVELIAKFSYFEGSERRLAPFRAWGCSRVTGCAGNSISFSMPVEDEQKVRFSVTSERLSGGSVVAKRLGVGEGPRLESRELPVTLSLVGDAGDLNLTRGFYVVVPMFEGDREPHWSSLEMKQAGGRWALHARGTEAAAELEHFVLRVDYATV
ncbi:MAG TPA: hypothetical protein VGF48_25350 [Thermoanaerobaculia bacterium]